MTFVNGVREKVNEKVTEQNLPDGGKETVTKTEYVREYLNGKKEITTVTVTKTVNIRIAADGRIETVTKTATVKESPNGEKQTSMRTDKTYNGKTLKALSKATSKPTPKVTPKVTPKATPKADTGFIALVLSILKGVFGLFKFAK